MAIALPHPATARSAPPASPRGRAYRQWQIGQGHAQREQWPHAATAFAQACGLDGDAAYALAAAHALIKAGRASDAAAQAHALRSRRPREALAYTLESHALLALGRAEDAVACLEQLPAELARDTDHWVSLAMALQRCGRHNDAIPAFMKGLAGQLDNAVLHFHLGMSFKDLGMKAQAAECVRTAVVLGLGTSDLAARGQLAFMEREACHWRVADETLAALRDAVRAAPADVAQETGPFPHAVLVEEPLEQLKVARLYALHCDRFPKLLPRRGARAHGGRIRLAYLSADFHEHATSQLIVQMLECHDRAAFEVTLLSTGPDDGSALRRRIEAAAEHFENLRGQSFDQIALRARALAIDILVDLKGATHNTLLPVLAQRPAPLQLSWLGFPGTSGAPFIDYFIGDPIVTPLADAAHFSEQIAQLPHCYQPNDAARALPRASTRAEWGVPAGGLLLCGFHQSYKISEEVFDVWCELLRERPDAVLWLLQWNVNVQSTLTAAARERGIAPERLLFAPIVPLADHLSRLACADIFLDTWPCNGHTTVGEALWCGVPVVTLIGQTFAQRVAASLLHQVELDEWVCRDGASYGAQVLALAADPARRAAIRERLHSQRSASPLFDGRRFARDIEALYQRMWQRAVSGAAPEHLAAEDAR